VAPYGPFDITWPDSFATATPALALPPGDLGPKILHALLRGTFRHLDAPPGVFAFVREARYAPAVVVAVNTATEPRTLNLPARGGRGRYRSGA
jgi:hypothetical protein